MKISTKIQHGKSLPYGVKIDELRGIGNCPASAVMAALSVGKKIPKGMRDRKKAITYILDNYLIDREWIKLIHILEENKFDEKEENKNENDIG